MVLIFWKFVVLYFPQIQKSILRGRSIGVMSIRSVLVLVMTKASVLPKQCVMRIKSRYILNMTLYC